MSHRPVLRLHARGRQRRTRRKRGRRRRKQIAHAQAQCVHVIAKAIEFLRIAQMDIYGLIINLSA